MKVVILGGGIAGCSVAIELRRRGVEVTVVDRDQPGSGATGASAGMLAPQYESGGPGPGFRFGLESKELWALYARDLEALAGWSVSYRATGMLVANRNTEEETAAENSLAWQHDAGLPGEILPARDAGRVLPGVSQEFPSYLWLPREDHLDVQSLAVVLADAVRGAGGRVLAGREALEIVSVGGRATGARLADDTTLSADAVVLAAGAWSPGIEGLPRDLPVRPVRGQILRLLPSEPCLPMLLADHGGRYLVPRPNGTILVGSTMEDVGYDDSTTEEGKAVLADAAVELLLDLGRARIVEHWSGLRPMTPDTWPVLGVEPEMDRLFYAAGYGRNGILFAPLAARAVADLVLDGQSDLDLEPFRVDRFDQTSS